LLGTIAGETHLTIRAVAQIPHLVDLRRLVCCVELPVLLEGWHFFASEAVAVQAASFHGAGNEHRFFRCRWNAACQALAGTAIFPGLRWRGKIPATNYLRWIVETIRLWAALMFAVRRKATKCICAHIRGNSCEPLRLSAQGGRGVFSGSDPVRLVARAARRLDRPGEWNARTACGNCEIRS